MSLAEADAPPCAIFINYESVLPSPSEFPNMPRNSLIKKTLGKAAWAAML
jgi:hypothetical protein